MLGICDFHIMCSSCVISILMICIILLFAVILWVCGLLWSQFCCICYCNSQWEEYVCGILILIYGTTFINLIFKHNNTLSTVLGSLLRLTGLMLAARERIPQVIFLLAMYFLRSFYCALYYGKTTSPFSLLLDSGHFNIFVGDLSPEVTDATLYACFSVYPSCS